MEGEIKRNPRFFEGYTKGYGIIATRERFLQLLETDEGEKGKSKTIIMPIAVPGFGMSYPSSTLGVGLFRTSPRQNLNCGGSDRAIPLLLHTER